MYLQNLLHLRKTILVGFEIFMTIFQENEYLILRVILYIYFFFI
jgi:hypothetical protein